MFIYFVRANKLQVMKPVKLPLLSATSTFKYLAIFWAFKPIILVFIEVKTRFSDEFGPPEEAVTPRKIKTIARVGDYYRLLNDNLPELSRIDVVAIDFNDDGGLERVELIENVTG